MISLVMEQQKLSGIGISDRRSSPMAAAWAAWGAGSARSRAKVAPEPKWLRRRMRYCTDRPEGGSEEGDPKKGIRPNNNLEVMYKVTLKPL